MEYNQLEVLEEKINKAIQLISELQAENSELKKYNMELITKAQENEKTIRRLQEEYKNLKDHQDQSEIYREKEEKIQKKIHEILDKLDKISS